jgi:general secretion pathway protein I
MDKRKRIFSGKLFCERGFTLVEILATFVLIAIILPVAMEGISLSTRMASESKRKIEAAALAEKKLTELIVTEDWMNGDDIGDFEDEYPDFTWRYEVSDWEKEDLIRQIDLHVEWTASNKTHSVTVTTLVYLTES